MRKIISFFLCVLMLCAFCMPAYADYVQPRGWVTLNDQDEDVYIFRKSCEISRLDVYCDTLIIDKDVTVTVSDIIDIGFRNKIILLGTLDISGCWGIYDYKDSIVVMDSGKLVTTDEECRSRVTHSKHFYINNKCVDCGEEKPFVEVDPYERELSMTGSFFSDYSLTMIVGMSAALVFGVGGFLLGRRIKKNAE